MDYKPLDPSANAIFESALSSVRGQLQVSRKDINVGLKLLSRFDELKNYQGLYVHNVTEIKGDTSSCILLLMEKHLTVTEYRRGGGRQQKEVEEIEPLLIFSLPVDIGKAIIKKETIADKVADLLYGMDIDFQDYPTFSKNYLLVGDDPDKVKEHVPKQLLSVLDKVENMTIEINGNWGLLRAEKNLTEDLLLLLISIALKLTKPSTT